MKNVYLIINRKVVIKLQLRIWISLLHSFPLEIILIDYLLQNAELDKLILLILNLEIRFMILNYDDIMMFLKTFFYTSGFSLSPDSANSRARFRLTNCSAARACEWRAAHKSKWARQKMRREGVDEKGKNLIKSR